MIAVLANLLYLTGLLLLGLAIFWDGVSLYLILSRIRKGSGPSAVPVVSWIIYFLWLVVLQPILEPLRVGQHRATQADPGGLQLFGVLTLLHLLCHAGIPALYGFWIGQRRRRPFR